MGEIPPPLFVSPAQRYYLATFKLTSTEPCFKLACATKGREMQTRHIRVVDVIVVAIPCLIYAVHAFYFGTWIVDDAAITFAYARNFAAGYGLVSQPGMPPVEGYSNFAWLLTLAPFFWLNVFDAATTPKLISLLLMGGAYIVLYQTLKPLKQHRNRVALVVFTLIALNTSVVVWTISGLENALLVFLVSLLLLKMVQVAAERQFAPRNALWLGILAVLLAMTRPDGLAYAAAFPAILLPVRGIAWRKKAALLLIYAVTFAAGYGGLIAFRLAYFDAPMPNTYYMKGGPELEDVIDLLTLQPQVQNKALALLNSVFGGLSGAVLVIMVAGSVFLMTIRKWTTYLWVVLVLLLCSLALYLLLPPDWMGEYRFATAFFLLFYLYAVLVIDHVLNWLPRPASRLGFILMSAVVIIASFQIYSVRSENFRQDPTVPMQYVKSMFADRFDWYQQALGLETASVMLPDIGGVIFYSDIMVYDIAGLTDRTVARYLGKNVYRPGFYDYVFETVQPTFIHVHGFWTHHARLEDDPRFSELYVPICSYRDKWVEQNYGVQRHSGDFIRRELAETHADELRAIQQGLDENCNL